jgi:hypothetical protein
MKYRWNIKYWLGRILGEDLFVAIFGYLHPIEKWDELPEEERARRKKE